MINLRRIDVGFNPIDKITLGYILTTLFYIIFSFGALENAWVHILIRFVFISFLYLLVWLTPRISGNYWQFLRNFYPLIFFGFFYSETDYLNNVLFNNLDRYIVKFELLFFGVHPSVVFSNAIPQVWFSELMNFGYFSYYFLILLLPLWLWVKRNQSFLYVIFVITFSFYMFYWIFILFPVAGPQFYLPESLRTIPDSGVFRAMVKFVEWLGEGPTAAFPSSHVGIVVIIGVLAFRYAREILWVYLVFGLLICLSTVYIKAHYAIDVIGGLLFAPIFLGISNWFYSKISSSIAIMP